MRSKLPTLQKNTWLFDLCFLTALFSIVYFFYLGHYPLLVPDEGRYNEIAREMLISRDFITPRLNGSLFLDKPILYYWFQALSFSLFGFSEWAARFFPALFGVFGCAVCYLYGRVVFNRRAGLLSAIILSASPLYFGAAHYSNIDLEIATLINAAIVFFVIATKKPARAHFFFCLSAGAFALAFLTKGLIGLIIPIMVLLTWVIVTKNLRTLRQFNYFFALGLFAILTLPWYVAVQIRNPEFFHYFFVIQHFSRYLSLHTFNNASPVWFYLPVIVVGTFPWLTLLPQTLASTLYTIKHRTSFWQDECLLIIWISAVLIFFSIPQSKIVTYILPVTMPIALLLGRYISSVWEKKRPPLSSMVFFIAISLGYGSVCLSAVYFHWLHNPALFPYLMKIGVVYLSGAGIALLCWRTFNVKYYFYFFFLLNMVVFYCSLISAIHLNTNSTKSIADFIREHQISQDQIVMYYKYYQDLPFYLQHQLPIVDEWTDNNILPKDNAIRELWINMRDKQHPLLISEDAFWKRWNSHEKLYVLLNEDYFILFDRHSKDYHVIRQDKDVVLITNKI